MSSGTDKIVSSIMSEAQGKADIIMQEANAEIATINADAEKTAESEKNKILENGKKQSDMRYQQIISEAKMNARRAELGAKEEVIEAAFDKATNDLKGIASSGSEEYDDSLTKMKVSMKKMILLSVFALGALSINAQTEAVLRGGDFWDNWYVGGRMGGTMNMNGTGFFKSRQRACRTAFEL